MIAQQGEITIAFFYNRFTLIGDKKGMYMDGSE